MVSWLADLSSFSICISYFTLSTVSFKSSNTLLWVYSLVYLSSSIWLIILVLMSVQLPCRSFDFFDLSSVIWRSCAYRAGKSFESVSSNCSTSLNLVRDSFKINCFKLLYLSSMNIWSWCSWFFLRAYSASKLSFVNSVIMWISCWRTKWISD